MSKVQLIVDSVTDHNAVCTKTDRNDVTVPQNLEYWILPPKGNPKGLYGGVRSAAEPSECSTVISHCANCECDSSTLICKQFADPLKYRYNN